MTFYKFASVGLILLLISPMGHGQTKISFFGDSLVQGYGLYPEEGMVQQLQATLHRAGKDVIVVNSGVSGDTSAGGLARIDWTLAEGFDGIMILLGGNDVLRGIDVQETRRNLAGILSVVAQHGIPALLIGHEAPSNYGQDYKRAFETIFTDLSQEYDVLFFPSVFEPITKRGDLASVRAAYFQEDLLHPNREGVHIIVNALAEKVWMLLEQIETMRDAHALGLPAVVP